MQLHYLLLALSCGLLSALGTWVLLPLLKRRLPDIPNARSNHKTTVPRGGGIAMIAAALLGMGLADVPVMIIAVAVLLASVSLLDDFKGLPPALRLLVQFLAVGIAISALPGRIFPDFIPLGAEWALVALCWIWFINLTNFMDGIDGISAMQAVMVCAGIVLMHAFKPWDLPSSLAVQAAILAACAYGFYLFNKQPARIFMGDVGSISLGFLTGYLLLCLAAYGYILPALILPAYYVSDATCTLIKRLLKKEKVWQAHADHAYQQAVRLRFTHAQVVARISWLNAALIGLALAASLSMMAGAACAVTAYGLTFWLMHRFTHA